MKVEFAQFQMIYDIFEIPIYIFDKECLASIPDKNQFFYPQEADSCFRNEIRGYMENNQLPILFLENDIVYYGLFKHEGAYYCLGPVSRNTMNYSNCMEYKKCHNLVENISVNRMGMGVITKILALLYLNIAGVAISYDDIQIVSKDIDSRQENWKSDARYEIYQIFQSESGRQHKSGIVFENQIMECVRKGDVETMKNLLSGYSPDISDFGEISTNSVREQEYMLVTMLTLMTRAAVEGGMNAEEAYVLGDIYLQRIETLHNDVAALAKLGMSAQIEFTEKVYKAKKQRSENLYIEKCKDYVVNNLRKNIKVGDIAPEIGVSGTYLSHKFSEIEGITIQQYIKKERCIHAANLLKYSDYPISVIAEYFCFSSQSHFGESFKKEFGMTPKEYRETHFR